jgi:YVTN family beta-propeller protein
VPSRPRLILAVLIVAVLGASGFAAAQTGLLEGRIGPESKIQPSGRKLDPAGKTTTRLGNLSAGGAPTPDGRFLWTLAAGRGHNDIRIVQTQSIGHCRKGHRGRKCRKRRALRVGRTVQTIPMPGLSGGMAISADGTRAYVAGLPESDHKDQKVDANVPGREGDVIHVFKLDRRSGVATRDGAIPVPPPDSAPVPQNFPPKTSGKQSWPRDVAVSPDGKTLLAALNLGDGAAVIDVASRKVRTLATGHYPYGAAILPDGRTGLVTSETDGTVSVIDLAGARKVKDIQVGPHLSHPEGIAVDPQGRRAYVAVAHQDVVAVLDLRTMTVERTLSVERPEGIGTEPTAVSVTPDGSHLLVSDSGEDAIAVFALPGGASARRASLADRLVRSEAKAGGVRASRTAPDFALLGRIPVSSYPTGAWGTAGNRLLWLSAKGLGTGPNPTQTNPTDPRNTDDTQQRFAYLPTLVRGQAGILSFPSDARLQAYSARADRALRPSNAEAPPAGSPIAAGAGKIDHVFYVVRENRTYDQIFGDDPRGDSDPKLSIFGRDLTPNAHALADRFGLLDHVFANSEASIDGHFWTSAGAVSDYVVKNWHQNYAGRKRPYDFGVYAVTWPAKRFLFDQAENQGVSYFNYGEAVAGVVPLTDKDRTQEETDQVSRKFAKSDLGIAPGCYPNDASIGKDAITGVEVFDSSTPAGAPPTATSRIDCFRRRFAQQVATSSVPAFNYLVLSNDHTEGTTPGRRTPQAMIADNDFALGQLVDTISHSPVWGRSLIMVVEDDSQDGADHVDAHRIPALAISPYSKRAAVVHTRYDFLSFIRTLELGTGMKTLNLFDALATPLYDAFSPDAGNAEPYAAVAPKQDRLARNTAASPAARQSARLNLSTPDRVPQRTLDSILWRAVHGHGAAPPPPGPNASGRDAAEGDDDE